MKPSFHIRQINGPFDDPGLFVRVIREGKALMFDLGWTTALSARDVLKITDIFISHTHVDHFIGFDNILRISLKKERPLRLYGPEGFIKCVESRIKGYTWNVVHDYPLVIEVFEVTENCIHEAVFRASDAFEITVLNTRPFERIIMRDSFYYVSACILDHQIPCLAFSLEEENHINIDKEKLNKRSLPIGPWLAELKMAIRENSRVSDFLIDGKTYSFEELVDIATITRGQKVSYVVDAKGSEQNKKKITDLVRGSDILFIEAYFLDEDKEMAGQRYHLTAAEAGDIAQRAKVGRLEPIHFSPRYMDQPERLVEEALRAFRRQR